MAEKRSLTEIARELSFVFKDARENAWMQVAECAQRLFASETTLLDSTRTKLMMTSAQLEVLKVIEASRWCGPYAKSIVEPYGKNCALHLLALLARASALVTWTPEKAEIAGLPWIGTKVFVDRGRLRGSASGTYEVWALREPADDVIFQSDVPAFSVWAPGSPHTLESFPLTAKDCGSWWKRVQES
jgi:hypothetical protein